MEPTGDLNPLHECARCGYHVYELHCHQGTVICDIEGHILRYGPNFVENYKINLPIDDIDDAEEYLYGQPVKFCSINCALDTVNIMFKDNPQQLTMFCVMLSGMYNISIPGLPASNPPKRYQVKKEHLNNNPSSLKRWGGNKTYAEFRLGFVSPPCPFTAEFLDQQKEINKPLDQDEYPVSEKRMPEDDAAAEDEMQYFHELAEADLIDHVDPDAEPFGDGEFDTILDPEFKS